MDNPASGDFAVLRPAPGPGPEAVAWEILLVNRHGVLIDQNARPAPPADPPPDAALAAPLQTPAVQAVFAEALGIGERPPEEQEAEVKRAKDRIKLRMRRKGPP